MRDSGKNANQGKYNKYNPSHNRNSHSYSHMNDSGPYRGNNASNTLSNDVKYIFISISETMVALMLLWLALYILNITERR